MGKFSFGAQRGFMPTEPAQPDPIMAVKPSGWQDKLALFGATLRDVGAGLGGQGGGGHGGDSAIAQAQKALQARATTAAQRAQLQQIEASITDPNELALFRTNPEAWSKARASQYETVNVGGGDSRFIPGQGFKTAPKLVADNGVYGTQTADGYTGTGARAPSIAEAETARQNDPNTLGGLSWGRVQDNGLGRDRLALDTTKAAQDYRLGMGNLGVSQGQLSLGRQRLSLDQGGGAPPSGYRKTATGGLEFIPGGPADPNAAKRAAPTEDQAKTEFNLGRQRNASTTINRMEGIGGSPEKPTVKFDRGALLTPGFMSEDKRSYDAAKLEWIDAHIRQTTGAAATKDEVEKADRAYFPQWGDTPKVIAQKARSRAASESGGAQRAGPAEKPASNGWSIVR